MAWANGNQSHTTVAQRRRIMNRDDGRCQIRGRGCAGNATEVDHIDNRRGLEYDTDGNLQAACSSCHKVKTQREARAARERHKRKPKRHPGLM